MKRIKIQLDENDIPKKWYNIQADLKTPLDPPLNPNHPNQSRKTPMVAKGILCPGMAFMFPFSYFPSLGPRMIAPIRAPQPPTA